MLDLYVFNSFKRDLKRLEKQGFDKKLLMETLDFLLYEKPLPPRYFNHPLKGNYIGCYDCHIKPDCVLIYSIKDNILNLHRIGSHSDLYK